MRWFELCLVLFREAGTSVILLLVFECFTLLLQNIQTLIKYGVHIVEVVHEARLARLAAAGGPDAQQDARHQGVDEDDGTWQRSLERHGALLYYNEFIMDTVRALATLAHYGHIWLLNGISFTLIDAILLLNMRSVFNTLWKHVAAHVNYRKVMNSLRSNYRDAHRELCNQA